MRRMLSIILTAGMALGTITMSFAATTDYFGHEGAKDPELTLESMLTYALEDEHLALASYKAIIEKFDVSRPFTNIMKAEERHITSIEALMKTYKIAIPSNAAITSAAEKEVVLPSTLAQIYSAGIQAEIANINLYKAFLKKDLPNDVRAVFEYLIKASESHQSAFERQIDVTIYPDNRGRNGRR